MVALDIIKSGLLGLIVNLASEEIKPVVQELNYQRSLQKRVRVLRESIIREHGDDGDALLSQAIECISRAEARKRSILVIDTGIDHALETLQCAKEYEGFTASMCDSESSVFRALCGQVLCFIWNELPSLDSVHKRLAAETHRNVLKIQEHVMDVGQTLNELKRSSLREAVEPEAASASVMVTRITQMAARSRLELEPRILPRIDRRVVSGSVMRAARFSVDTGEPRVISLVGPAGYGKTSLLGHIYDRLAEQSDCWIAVALCDLLEIPDTASGADLDLALGRCISGVPEKASTLLARLANEFGKGVVLIDTLDLILNRRTSAAISALLRDLLTIQVTPIFTCRDVEYDDLIQPVFDKFPSMSGSIERYRVPPFEPDDIRNATIAFIHARPELTAPDGGEAFAASVAELSADGRPLQEITQSPLLLAMLCDLFAKDGCVPEDITISKLYSTYWQQRISGSRKYGANSPICSAKRRFCINAASRLFELSAEKLAESASLVDLDPAGNDNTACAIAELRSDGVIQTTGQTDRVRFFHQTLEEYAIAQWLSTDGAAQELEEFISALRSQDSATMRLYRWPILRQLLSIVDEERFVQIAFRMRMSNIAAFRTAALAASARVHRPSLIRLMNIALERGSEFEQILVRAMGSAPASIENVFWEVAIAFVSQGSVSQATEICKQAGRLITRWNTPWHTRIAEIFDAIDMRTTSLPDQADESGNLRGQLVNSLASVLVSRLDTLSLEALRDRYRRLGPSAKAKVLSLHLLEHIPHEARHDLLITMISEPLVYELRRDARWLVLGLLPGIIGTTEQAIWSDWREALYADTPTGWEMSLPLAIGKFLADDEQACREAIAGLTSSETTAGLDKLLLALRSASEQGGSSCICSAIVSSDISGTDPRRLPMLADLVVEIAGDVTGPNRRELATWVMGRFAQHPIEFLRSAMAVADDSHDVYVTLLERLVELPLPVRTRELRRLIRSAPDQIALALSPFVEQHLADSGINIESDLLHRYALQALTSVDAAEYLSQASMNRKKSVALAASKSLREIAAESTALRQEHLIPLIASMFAEVRKNALDALIVLGERDKCITVLELASICEISCADPVPSIVQRACDLLAGWTHRNGAPNGRILRVLETLVLRILEEDRIRSDVTRPLLIAMKVLALTEDRSFSPVISALSRRLLKRIDFSGIRNATNEVSSLLCALDRLEPDLLESLVTEGMAIIAGNQPGLARAIRIVSGERSALLDIMLKAEWGSTKVKSDILNWRGA